MKYYLIGRSSLGCSEVLIVGLHDFGHSGTSHQALIPGIVVGVVLDMGVQAQLGILVPDNLLRDDEGQISVRAIRGVAMSTNKFRSRKVWRKVLN